MEALDKATDPKVLRAVESALLQRPQVPNQNDADFEQVSRDRVRLAQAQKGIPIEEVMKRYAI